MSAIQGNYSAPITAVFLAICMFNCSGGRSSENSSSLYHEPHRPQFHFSQPDHWMNDPNGLVFAEGQYHLFYQYYPEGMVWGPMHWGHATTTDLVHWKNLPIALYPDSLGMIFSGSAVFDEKNTSGFGTSDHPPLVAIFTYHNEKREKLKTKDHQTQGIAYSTDQGNTWTKYPGNPVIGNSGQNDFRDPKVFWHKNSGKWILILAAFDHVEIFNSPDLKTWKHVSDFGLDQGAHGGVWECPDLFPLKVKETGELKWVMLVSLGDGGPNGGSATQYFLGEFDGEKFTNSLAKETVMWIDYGRDNYAGVTWNGLDDIDRRVLIGWMSNWQYAKEVPTNTWRSAMTIPREIALINSPAGIRMTSLPVAETSILKKDEEMLSFDEKMTLPLKESQIQVSITIENPAPFEFELSNELGEKVLIGLDDSNRYYIDRNKSGKMDFSPLFKGRQYGPRMVNGTTSNVTLLIDRSSVELFADDGLTVMTSLFFPTKDFTTLSLHLANPSSKIILQEASEMKGIWN